MSKLYFNSDYMEGCHPSILEKLTENNFEKIEGYGEDYICEQAKEKIRKAVGNSEADVRFLVGGTQTNATVLDTLLESYEGVLCCDTGHIETHEAGAVEAFGHKVVTIPNIDGKLTAKTVSKWCDDFYANPTHDHLTYCGCAYISNPTESGTVYTTQELKELYEACHNYGMLLYCDGARLGYALATHDFTLEDMGKYTDAFYIGGTKVGALFGEAVVFKKKELSKKFMNITKRHGALLAKGWLLGVQFDALFTDDLYFKLGANALVMADMLEKGLVNKGYKMDCDSKTNQKFVVLDDSKYKELDEKIGFTFWSKPDETHTVVRFVTSWATTEKQINGLLELL